MGRLEWLEERKTGIGGSDAAAIIGQNPYMTNVELWEIKTGRKEQEDISDKQCVKYGVAAESHIRDLYRLDYPELYVENEEYKIYKNIKYPFIRGSFDGVITDGRSGRTGVLEIKTTSIERSSMLNKWEGQIPQNYYIQILHYFLVREDFEFAILRAKLLLKFKQYFNGIYNVIPTEIREYPILRDDPQVISDMEYLLQKEQEFWGYVDRDERPPLIIQGL